MISQTCNMDMVNSILSHPDIWPEIAPEGVEPFDVAYMPDVLYFLMNEADGVVIFHPFRDAVKIHPNILPKRRGKFAYQAVDEAINEMFARGFDTIYAEIDPKLKHVVSFAKRLGFRLIERGKRDIFVRRHLDS